MKHKIIEYLILSLIITLSFSCSNPKIIKLGSNYGGIIENSKPDASRGATTPVDAVSGATQSGSTASLQTTFEFKGHTFQTGIDYVSHRQKISYDDTLHGIYGRRSFQIHQLRVPLFYNINLLRDFDKVPTIMIHLGFSGGLTLSPGITDELYLGLPGYTFSSVDIGPQLGITLQPLQIDYHHYLGLYIDFYRGTRIYEDVYHKDKGVGNLSFYKFGALLYFR
jgi:hypothetical protein